MSDWLLLTGTILGALIVNAGGWWLIRSQRQKNLAEATVSDADAADKLTGAALRIVKQLEKSVADLQVAKDRDQERITELEQGREQDQRRIMVLEAEVEGLKLQVRDISGRNQTLMQEKALIVRQLLDLGIEPVVN